MISYSLVGFATGLLSYGTIKYFKGFVCDDNLRVDNKNILITGANTGIGLETAKELARRGANIFITCRSNDKCNYAKEEIIKYSGVDKDKVKTFILDLSSFKSILEFSTDFKKKINKLDVLINNAGLLGVPYCKTEDGFEMVMGVNYVGHFVLSSELIDLIKDGGGGRIVNVSSRAHRNGTMKVVLNLEGTEQEDYGKYQTYCNSKLANVLHTKQLWRLYRQDGVISVCLHPGVVETEIWRNLPGVFQVLGSVFGKIFFKNAWQGAQTSIYCAATSAEEFGEYNGCYFSDGEPREVMNNDARDEELAQKLWDLTHQLTDEKIAHIKKTLAM